MTDKLTPDDLRAALKIAKASSPTIKHVTYDAELQNCLKPDRSMTLEKLEAESSRLHALLEETYQRIAWAKAETSGLRQNQVVRGADGRTYRIVGCLDQGRRLCIQLQQLDDSGQDVVGAIRRISSDEYFFPAEVSV